MAEQPFGRTTLYPAVGLNSAGEEARLIDGAELWGIDTEPETQHNTPEGVCLSTCLSISSHFRRELTL